MHNRVPMPSSARPAFVRLLRRFTAIAVVAAGLGVAPGIAAAQAVGQITVAVTGPATAVNQETVTYQFTVTNTGAAVPGFVFFDIGYTFPLLQGTAFVAPQDWQCNLIGGTPDSPLVANCAKQGLGAGEVAAFTLTAVVSQGCVSEQIATVNGSVGAASPLGTTQTRIPPATCETTTLAPTTTTPPTTAAPETTVAPTTIAPSTIAATTVAPAANAPVATVAATVAPVATTNAARQGLPATGVDHAGLGLVASALVACGAALLLIARRRPGVTAR